MIIYVVREGPRDRKTITVQPVSGNVFVDGRNDTIGDSDIGKLHIYLPMQTGAGAKWCKR